MRFKIVAVILFLTPIFLLSQGPGNITTNLQLWLKADEGVYNDNGVTLATDGQNIRRWNDAHTSANDATQSTEASKPTYNDDDANAINFNPVVTYSNGANNIHFNLSGITLNPNSTDFTVYTIFNTTDGSIQQTIFGQTDGSGTGRNILRVRDSDDKMGSYIGNENSISTSTTSFGIGVLEVMAYDENGASSTVTFYSEGLTDGSNTVNPESATGAWHLGIAKDGTSNDFDGNMAELIIIDAVSSAADRQKIESYLAIKYGITLTNDNDADASTFEASNADGLAEGDYVASDGGVVWDGSATSSYHYDIAGIGRDDNSELGQVKSKSENTDAILTVYADGEGTNASNSFTDIANDEWFIWGNDNGAATFTTTGAPTNVQVLTRKWHVEETGDVGAATFMFDVADSDFDVPAANGSTYYMIYDSDDDGSLSDESIIELYDDGTNGDETSSDNIWSIQSINMSDGMEFTLAMLSTAPGGVTSSLEFWVKADAEVYEDAGTDAVEDDDGVYQWNDVSGNGFIATQATAGSRPTYNSDDASSANYNPTFTYDGTADYLEVSYNVALNPANLNYYSVGKVTNGSTTFRSAVTSRAAAPFDADEQGFSLYAGDQDKNEFFTGIPGAGFWTEFVGDLYPTGYQILLGSVTEGTGNSNIIIYGDGELENSSTTGTYDKMDTYSRNLRIGTGKSEDATPDFYWYGDIAEQICYSSILSSTDRNKIDSYLAIKYGITLTNDNDGDASTFEAGEGDYTSSAGTTIWDASAVSSYHNDIAGIGRDDNSALGQVKSKSQNSDAIVTIYADSEGTNASNSFVDITDDEFMFWGNNNGNATFTSTGAPSGYKILARQWHVEETGDVGTVTFMFDVHDTDFDIPSTAENYYLVYDDDDDGVLTDETPVLLYDDGTNGDETTSDGVYSIQSINIGDAEEFTLAVLSKAPGGVSTNLLTWLKADAGTYEDAGTDAAEDNDLLYQWDDLSGLGYNAIQTSSGDQAAFNNDASSMVNYNPVVTFDGSSNEHYDINSLALDPNASSLSLYAIFNVTNVSTNRNILQNINGSGTGRTFAYINTSSKVTNFLSGSTNAQDGTISTGAWEMACVAFNSNGASSTVKHYIKGEADGSATITPEANVGTWQVGLNGSNDQDFLGDMAELILYDTELSTASDRQKIETYLAIKYGITLTNDNDGDASTLEAPNGDGINEGDYLASDAGIIWDASGLSTYHNDIAGIGRDDASALGQVQSKSQNSDAIVTIYADSEGTNSANSFVDIADDEWMLWGNDNGAVTWTTTGAPTNWEIVTRQWHIEETGDVGDVTIMFDIADSDFDIPALTKGSNYYLIYDSDNDAVLTDETPVQLYDDGTNGDETASDNIWSIRAINFDSGEEFTLAQGYRAPGRYSTDLVAWFKADAGVYEDAGTDEAEDNDLLYQWNDQSGSGYNAVQATSGNRPAFNNDDAKMVNFNPVTTWDGSSDEHLDISSITYNPNSQDFSIFAVFQTPDNNADNCIMGQEDGAGSAKTLLRVDDVSEDVRSMIGGTVTDYATNKYTFGTWNIATLTFNENGASSETDLYDRGYAEANETVTPNSADGNWKIGNDEDDTEDFGGDIAEIIIYDNDVFGASDRRRIHSYLAIKYGITLNNAGGGSDGDYENGEGTKIWDASTNSTYHYGVAGIARDDGSDLSQVKSKSSDSTAVVTIFADSEGTNSAPSFVDMDDLEYMLWGNNNGNPDWTTTGAPTGYVIMERQWHIEIEGGDQDVGSVTISFDVNDSQMNLPEPPGKQTVLYLIYDADNDADLSDETPVQLYDDGTNGDETSSDNVYSIQGISFNDGEEFTLAAVLEAPGGIATNLHGWFMGNRDVYTDAGSTAATDGDKFQQWNDQSGNENHGIQTTSGDQSTFQDDATHLVNFNEACQWDGFNGAHYDLAEITWDPNAQDFSIYTVFNLNNDGDDQAIVAQENGTGTGNTIWRVDDSAEDIRVDVGGTAIDSDDGYTWGDTKLAGFTFNESGASSPIAIFVDGKADGTGTANPDAADGQWRIGTNKNDTKDVDGELYEILLYKTELNSATDRQKIESYLAIKYGVSLSNDTDDDASALEAPNGDGVHEGDYVASDGGVVWDASANSTYHNWVTGIGRDDGSGLDQRISATEATSSPNVTVALENDFSTKNSSRSTAWSADDSFLMWGNDMAASTFSTSYGGANRFTRVWQFQGTGTVPNIYIQFTDSDLNNSTTYHLIGGQDPPTDWNNVASATSEGSGNTVKFGPVNITQYNYWTVADASVLPVELISWTAKKDGKIAVLEWKLASELNNDFFTIERSDDNENWEILGTIDGAGTSNEITSYQFVDYNPHSGVNYYRLKQTDFDGSYKYFDTKQLNFSGVSEIKIYPNPATNQTMISFDMESREHYVIELVSMLGQVLYYEEILLVKGKNTLPLPVSQYAKGVYFINVKSGNSLVYSNKLVVERE